MVPGPMSFLGVGYVGGRVTRGVGIKVSGGRVSGGGG